MEDISMKPKEPPHEDDILILNSYQSKFAGGDLVWVDHDQSLTGTVTGLLWEGYYEQERHTVRVSWMHNGAHHEQWFDPNRLRHSEGVL